MYIYTKFAIPARLCFPYFITIANQILLIFKMLFGAVVIDFVLLT